MRFAQIVHAAAMFMGPACLPLLTTGCSANDGDEIARTAQAAPESTGDALRSAGWTEVDEDTYRLIHEDGAVSTRLFGSKARAAHLEFLQNHGALASEATIGAPENDFVQPEHVVAGGDQCAVQYSINHRTFVFSVGPATLGVQATSSATPDLFGPSPGVKSVAHYDAVEVVPTSLASNQGVTFGHAYELQQAPFGTPVTAKAYWNDDTQWQAADLCTATAYTSISVQYATAKACWIVQQTNFPACVPVK